MAAAIGLVRYISTVLAATLCRPDSWSEKTGPKLTAIGILKNRKKGFDKPFDRPFELWFELCFQQGAYWGGGCLAEGHQQWVARETKTSTTKDTKEHKGKKQTICSFKRSNNRQLVT
jgi:hypothetical protein